MADKFDFSPLSDDELARQREADGLEVDRTRPSRRCRPPKRNRRKKRRRGRSADRRIGFGIISMPRPALSSFVSAVGTSGRQQSHPSHIVVLTARAGNSRLAGRSPAVQTDGSPRHRTRQSSFARARKRWTRRRTSFRGRSPTTSSGGGAACKTDWTPLAGRRVLCCGRRCRSRARNTPGKLRRPRRPRMRGFDSRSRRAVRTINAARSRRGIVRRRKQSGGIRRSERARRMAGRLGASKGGGQPRQAVRSGAELSVVGLPTRWYFAASRSKRKPAGRARQDRIAADRRAVRGYGGMSRPARRRLGQSAAVAVMTTSVTTCAMSPTPDCTASRRRFVGPRAVLACGSSAASARFAAYLRSCERGARVPRLADGLA